MTFSLPSQNDPFKQLAISSFYVPYQSQLGIFIFSQGHVFPSSLTTLENKNISLLSKMNELLYCIGFRQILDSDTSYVLFQTACQILFLLLGPFDFFLHAVLWQIILISRSKAAFKRGIIVALSSNSQKCFFQANLGNGNKHHGLQ